jgi:hypothetical protein
MNKSASIKIDNYATLASMGSNSKCFRPRIKNIPTRANIPRDISDSAAVGKKEPTAP